MESFDNNQFEVKSSKRKIPAGPNVYLNPALDLLANEDPMCNTAMEITANRKRKRTRSCEIVSFENNALDLGVHKAAVNEFLIRELENVRKNMKSNGSPAKSCSIISESNKIINSEPVYANLSDTKRPVDVSDTLVKVVPTETAVDCDSSMDMDSGISIIEQKSFTGTTINSELEHNDLSSIHNITNMQTNITNQLFVNNTSNLNLSFIDRLALDSPIGPNQSLYLDDDLNESNIMEIKTITIITKKKIITNKKNTNPFLDPNLNLNVIETGENPFLYQNHSKDMEYNGNGTSAAENGNNLMPRRLFVSDTNSTVSTVNESSLNTETHDYENVCSYRSESPIYENIGDDLLDSQFNKQSKILGCDVSQFNSMDILNKNNQNHSNNSNDSKKDLKHQFIKASNKLSKKVFRTLKKKFKGEKTETNVTLNPYEVPRKPIKQKIEKKEPGIENPALNLDNSDEIEIEELEGEHQYETIKTIRNTRLNTNVTPLKERDVDNINVSHNRTYTPGKKVRFDSTLNKEKIITGNSFDCDIQSPGFDAKIDKYQDELENCINERKFIQQNM